MVKWLESSISSSTNKGGEGGILVKLSRNSFKAIDNGDYDIRDSYHNYNNHESKSLVKAIKDCIHAPLITEIKFASPSRGKILPENDKKTIINIANTMLESGAIGISILTQPYLFNGSIENIISVRKNISIPILMKDIMVSKLQIDAAKKIGADYILLIKSIFDNNLAEDDLDNMIEYSHKKGLNIIYEVHTKEEMDEIIKINTSKKTDIIGINNRNLDNLEIDLGTTELLLKNYDKQNNIVISESGISTVEQIRFLKRCGADGFLIGTSIMESKNMKEKLMDLYLAL